MIRWTWLPLVAVLIVACQAAQAPAGPPSPTPDTQATIADAVEATLAARPTEAPTSTPAVMPTLPPTPTRPPTPTATSIATPTATASPAPTTTPTPVTPLTPTSTHPPICFWSWAYEDYPELSAQVQAAMDSAGIGATKVVATGFGEDFICDDGTVTFHAMETDFRVVYRQDDPEDLDAVGARIAAILAVLEEFPPDRTPGPAGGYIDLVVNPESGGGLSFRVAFSRAMELHMEGLEGAALTGALGYQPAP